MPENIQDTLNERGARYGDFTQHAGRTQAIITAMSTTVAGSAGNYFTLDAVKKQALDVIADKCGRILTGDPEYDDNWRDIIGYAQLAFERLPKQGAPGEDVMVAKAQAMSEAQEAVFRDARDYGVGVMRFTTAGGTHVPYEDVCASDCATHNEPAMPNGPCDCGEQLEAMQKSNMDWETTAVELERELADDRRLGQERQQAHDKEVAYLRAQIDAWRKRFTDLAALTPPKPAIIGIDLAVKQTLDKMGLAYRDEDGNVQSLPIKLSREERINEADMKLYAKQQADLAATAKRKGKEITADIMARTAAAWGQPAAASNAEPKLYGIELAMYEHGKSHAEHGASRGVCDTFEMQIIYDRGYDSVPVASDE